MLYPRFQDLYWQEKVCWSFAHFSCSKKVFSAEEFIFIFCRNSITVSKFSFLYMSLRFYSASTPRYKTKAEGGSNKKRDVE